MPISSGIIVLSVFFVGVFFYVISGTWLTTAKAQEKNKEDEEKKGSSSTPSADDFLKIRCTVKLNCESCVQKVKTVLKDIPGVKNFDINLSTKQVIVFGSVDPTLIKSEIEKKTGFLTTIESSSPAEEISESSDSPLTKMEFAVQMVSITCVSQVESALKELKGISTWDVNLTEQQVVVIGSASAVEIQKTLEGKTGLKTIIRGQGSIDENLGCAYTAIRQRRDDGSIDEDGKIIGVIRFIQLSDSRLLVEGEVDGLKAGLHGVHIHEYGDLTAGYKNIGDHYNPHTMCHGGPTSLKRHYGDLGNMVADEKGRGKLRVTLVDEEINIWNLIGRSVCIKEDEDDLGVGLYEDELKQGGTEADGNSGSPIAVGIIARSSGVYQNAKTICTCSGTTLWESDPVDKYSA